MSEAVTYLLQYAITPAVVVGIIGWLVKRIVIEALQRERIALKGMIERDSALAIERVRNASQKELEQARHAYSQELEEKKVRFARLHEKRFEPILQMHSVLAELVEEVEHALTVIQHEIDHDLSSEMKKIAELVASADLALSKTRVFLPKDIARAIGSLVAKIRDAEQEYYVAITHEGNDIHTANAVFRKQGGYRQWLAYISDYVRCLIGVEEAEQTL